MSCWYAAASSSGLRSVRWTFSTRACSRADASSVVRISARIASRPAARPCPARALAALVGGARAPGGGRPARADRRGRRVVLPPPTGLGWRVRVGRDRRAGQPLVPAGAEAFGRAGGDQGAESLTQTAF